MSILAFEVAFLVPPFAAFAAAFQSALPKGEVYDQVVYAELAAGVIAIGLVLGAREMLLVGVFGAAEPRAWRRLVRWTDLLLVLPVSGVVYSCAFLKQLSNWWQAGVSMEDVEQVANVVMIVVTCGALAWTIRVRSRWVDGWARKAVSGCAAAGAFLLLVVLLSRAPAWLDARLRAGE